MPWWDTAGGRPLPHNAGTFDPGFSGRVGQEDSSSAKITKTGRPGYTLTIHTCTGAEECIAGSGDNDWGWGSANTPVSVHAITHTNTGHSYRISSVRAIPSLCVITSEREHGGGDPSMHRKPEEL